MRKLGFPALLAFLWLLFFAAWYRFPYIRPGADIVYAAKEEAERAGRVFPASVPPAHRLIVFGNSKVLSGFIPPVFDGELQTAFPGVYSANLGKPDESHFARDLEMLAANGQLAHHIVLTLPWSAAPAVPLSENDDLLARSAFPFRRLPRDFALFTAMAPAHGGMQEFYRYGKAVAGQVGRDRGWYFISGQSHFPGNRLPQGFSLASDTPDRIDDPAYLPKGEEFTRIRELAEEFDLHFYVLPIYHRTGELAPSPEFAAGVADRLKGWERFRVVGPNYLLLPERYFSDPVHLNPAGAEVYTRELARLLRTAL